MDAEFRLLPGVSQYNAGNPTDDTYITFPSFNHCGSHLDEEQNTNSGRKDILPLT